MYRPMKNKNRNGRNKLKKKIRYLDMQLRKNYLQDTFGLIAIFGIITLFLEKPIQKIAGVIGLLLVLIIWYAIKWYAANNKKKITLKINNSEIEIKFGDIFEQPDLKIIPFNEYFDTLVDNKIISEKSLNGILIKKTNKDEIDALIASDSRLKENQTEYNNERKAGKNQKYNLGSLVNYRNEYVLTAFSKFDKNNCARLDMRDYINTLLTFWDEIDAIYSGRSISIPLFGSGMTRFKEFSDISDQELLELLIWSFKVSRINFTHSSKISIVLLPEKQDKINLYKLKEIFSNAL
jgi:hypothetical protein